MKNIISILSITAAVLLFGCKANDNANEPSGTASLTINIGGEAGLSRASDNPTQINENNIFNYTVLVYNKGLLEKKGSYTVGLTQTIADLTTGLKKIVVLANLPAGFVLPEVGATYASLTDQKINLDDQQTWTTGLVMSGEASANLEALPASNTVTIKVSRIVAKVIIGSITVNQPSGQTGTFELENVYVTKARSISNIGIPSTSPVVTSAPYYGGFSNIVVNLANVRSYLNESIAATTDVPRYFYVFANDNSDNNATIMGIRAKYDGQISFFPFIVNNNLGGGDGTYILPNHQYTLNITINNPGVGSPNPEEPALPATLTVTVTPENWKVAPVQNVAW